MMKYKLFSSSAISSEIGFRPGRLFFGSSMANPPPRRVTIVVVIGGCDTTKKLMNYSIKNT